MENNRFLNSYRNTPPCLLKKSLDWYEKPELWNGFKAGLIVAGLNHAMHMGVKAIETHNLQKNTPLPPAVLARLATLYGGALLEPTVVGEVVAAAYTAYLVATYGSEVIQQIIDYMTLPEMKENPPNHPDYKSPKSGDTKVRNPNGTGTGWQAKDGKVWVPTDHDGTHAPHWDVQDPRSRKHQNIYPKK